MTTVRPSPPLPPQRRAAACCGARLLLLALVGAPAALWAWPAGAENRSSPEVADAGDAYRIGMSAPLNGLNAGSGEKMRVGVEACFHQVNAQGGVNGHPLRLIAYDDHYEPVYTLVNTRRLLADDHVLALCSYYGTPTVLAVLPMLEEARMPLVGSSSGADGLVQPPRKYFFGAVPTYGEQTELLVKELVANGGCRRIGVFYQDDGFGESILHGTDQALRRRGLAVAVAASHLRSSTNVAAAIETVCAVQPDAVILGCTYPGAAAFARAIRRRLPDTVLCTVGHVGSEDFVAAAAEAANGVYIAQPTPSPSDSSVRLVNQYQQAMQAAGEKELTYFSLLGYLHARLLVEGVRHAGAHATTASFFAAMDRLVIDLGDYLCAYAPDKRQGRQQVYLTRVEGGRIRAVDRIAPR